jgi:lipid A 3-O-deacylase
MKTICALAGILSLFTIPSFAGPAEVQPMTATASTAGPFDRGTWEFESGAGFFGSFSTSAPRPTINYQLNDLRLGWMYDSPRRSGWLRGNSEFLLEALAGPVTKGPGTYLAGGSLIYRYNFIQPGSRWVPYFQIQAGALGNNIYRGSAQREVGEGFEFILGAGPGIKYMINDQWSVAAEAGYRHISDANLSQRNEGLNSLGGQLQVSYRFH